MVADTSILCPVSLGGGAVGLINEVPSKGGPLTGYCDSFPQ
jgi:hypothetical protein